LAVAYARRVFGDAAMAALARLRWDHGHEFGADAVEQAGAVLGS
jgi:hypothetical protein